MRPRKYNFKVIKGHTLDEYNKKYGKAHYKCKLLSFSESEKFLMPYYNKRTYWKIKDNDGKMKYFAIPNIPVPNKSLVNGLVCFLFLAGATIGSVFITRHLTTVGHSFKTDSWRQFAEVANQGLDKLIEYYKPNGGTFIITPEDNTQEKVDAKMRTVKVDGHGTFKVRVIGEAHDTLSSDESKTAALTFEFVDIVDDAVAYNQKFPQGSDPTKAIITDYKTTIMHDYCNNMLFDKLPDDLRHVIQPVKKSTICLQMEPTRNFYECITDEKIFPLSVNEMGFPPKYQSGVEGSTYEYYLNRNTENDYLKYYYDKNFGTRNAIPYWTRTTASSSKAAVTISFGGFEGESSSTSSGWFAGLAPAFCIGVNEHNFNNDSWTNVAEQANQGLKHLKEYYGRNTFIGAIKRVEYQDQSYRVRVIGENHDIIANTDNKKVAALTFQFLDVPIVDVTYDEDSNDWTTSDLRETCNNFVSNLPADITENIKPVLKEAVKQNDTTTEIVKNTEYLFPLSAAETGDTACSGIEGSVYKYFEPRYMRQFDELRTSSYRIGSSVSWLTTPCKTWSRSAQLANVNNAYCFSSSPIIVCNETQEINNPSCVAPAFCLGEDNAKVTFNNDSWENVIKYANEGLNSLKEAYDLTTFIGQTRKLKYDGQDYDVRVIGETTDILANEENFASALTFEFTKPIMESIYDEDSTDWETSTLRANCETAYDKIDTEVKGAIQPVKKESYYMFSTSETEPIFPARKSTVEKLFPLSEYEITSSYSNMELGGPRYKYYEVHYPTYVMLDRTFLCRNRIAKEPINNTYKSYWLRSPVLEEGVENYVYSVEYGNDNIYHIYEQADTINTSKSVCPAFCIGKTRSFMSDSWENLINDLNKGGLPYLQYVYGRSNFIGEERDIKFGDKKIRVRVVGQNHDQLAVDDHLTATFTFDCVEVLDTAPWNETIIENDNYHYLDTTLYQYVSNEDNPNSLISRFKDDNPIIYDNLKTVKKYLTDLALETSGGYPFIDTTTYEAKLFLPHSGELYAADLFGVLTKNIGLTLPYQFFQSAAVTLGTSMAAGVPGHRAKNYYYWTATAAIINSDGYEIYGDLSEQEYTTQPAGIAPMFCL